MMAVTTELAATYRAAGARFIAVGVDTALLASATTTLRRNLPAT